MKKVGIGILCVGMFLFCMAGCGSTKEDETSILTEEDFISNLEKGLENRWDISGEDTSLMSISEAQEHLTKCIDEETDVLLSMDRYAFEDKTLEGLAQQYFNALDLQREGVQYSGTEQYEEYEQTFQLGYYYRVITIYELNKNFGLTVGTKYQSTLDDVIAEYNVSLEAVTIQEYVNELTASLNYTKDEEKSDEYSTYYSTVIENTTDFTIDALEIDLLFVDTDGVTIYQTMDYIDNFKSGTKYRSSLYVDVDTFDHIEYDVTAYCY